MCQSRVAEHGDQLMGAYQTGWLSCCSDAVMLHNTLQDWQLFLGLPAYLFIGKTTEEARGSPKTISPPWNCDLDLVYCDCDVFKELNSPRHHLQQNWCTAQGLRHTSLVNAIVLQILCIILYLLSQWLTSGLTTGLTHRGGKENEVIEHVTVFSFEVNSESHCDDS